MKNVIYIGAGILALSVNVVDAKCSCKGNKDEGIDNGKGKTLKKLPSNLGIYIGDEAFVNKNDYFRNDAAGFMELEGAFKINKNDLGTDVSAFERNGEKNFLFVCTKMFYDKQGQSIKNNNLRPIGNTGYYACCIEGGNILGKNKFDVTPLKGETEKFGFVHVITAS